MGWGLLGGTGTAGGTSRRKHKLPAAPPPPNSLYPQITQLKIDHNPFAKGFRDNFDS